MNGMKWAVLSTACILANAGLSSIAVFAADSPTSIVTPDTQNVPVTEVEVKAVKEKVQKPKEGSAEVGYKVEDDNYVGPWGQKKILDTPYSVNVVSNELIKNTITNNPDQLFKMLPGVQLLQPYEMNGLTRVMMRGFLIQNQLTDGIQGDYAGEGLFLENVESIDVLNGLSGFMYGIGNVGGTLDYETKRPTPKPLYDLTIGDYGGYQYFAHADMGGPIDKAGKFGYRVNIMGQSGDTAIKEQSLTRYMLSGAFDWHAAPNLLVSTNAMFGHYRLDGRPGQWGFSSTLTQLPSAPEATRLWASPDTFNEEDTTHVGAKVTYDINDKLTFRTGYGFNRLQRKDIITSVTATSGTAYTLNTAYPGMSETDTHGGYAYIDYKFNVFGITNKFTAGFNGYTYNSYVGYVNGASPTLGSAIPNLSLSNPDSAEIPLGFNFGSMQLQKVSDTSNENYVLADEITFNNQWSILAGMNYSEYIVHNFSSTGAATTKYDKSGISPSFSLLYKPLANITTYATYIQSLEQGTTVTNSGSTIFTNNGTVFDPMTSDQYEVGAKVELGKALLTGSLFWIDKALVYTQDNANGTYTDYQNGRQVHKGGELTLSGKVTDDLTLFGGVTLMNAKVLKSTNSSAVGETPQGVAEQLVKLYAEYELPFFRGLTLCGDVNYTGKSYVNVTNTQEVPSYITGNAGVRYSTNLYGWDTIFRATVTNVSDERYWTSNATIGAMPGAPRTVALSATIKM